MGNKFTVKESNIEGKGCFATFLIKKGELICDMKGQLLSIPELIEKYEKGEERISDPLQVEEGNYIDLDEPYIFFNHSCEPNAAIVGLGKLVAIRNIKENEEITYDYSATEWTSDDLGKYKEWAMECKCSSKLCRGIIKEFPLTTQSLQRRYVDNKIVQDFIIKKYNEFLRTRK
jgi:SET domain-containing protein